MVCVVENTTTMSFRLHLISSMLLQKCKFMFSFGYNVTNTDQSWKKKKERKKITLPLFSNLLPKMRKSLRPLGRGHLAQLAFWKVCFLKRYSLGKNVLVVWFSSVGEKKKTEEYYPESASCPRLQILADDVWFFDCLAESTGRSVIFSLLCFCVTLPLVITTRI